MTRIFLSHSSRDSRQAVALMRWLVENEPSLAGEIFLDIDPDTGLAPGVRWRDALTRTAARCEAVVCLLSTDWESSQECTNEYRTAETLNKRIFCARLDATAGRYTHEWQHCDLFGDGPTTEITVDGEPIVFRTEGLRRLLRGLRDAGVGAEHFAWPPPGDPDRAPYRGWEPLEEQDAAVFFGRDEQIISGLDKLRGMRASGSASLFVVLGPSGAGKSSFLRAGLLPRLRRDDRHFLPLGIVRPERAALTGEHGLARAIHTTRAELGLPAPPLGEIKAACRSGDATRVTQWLREIRQKASDRLLHDTGNAPLPTLILPVDQAEELFAADAGPQASQFLTLLARLTRHSTGDDEPLFLVAATIRSDRFETLQTVPELADVRSELFNELKPMPRTEFKEVVCGPAARATAAGRPLEVEPALLNRLLSACGQGADTLPLLALTMARLYEDYGSSGRLTLAEYTAMGGMHAVVQTEIDNLLSSDPDERSTQLEHLRAAFVPWLANIDQYTDQPMRRLARWSDLPAPSRPLLDAMVARRLLVKGERDGDVVVEVALESLLRQWTDLAGWLHEERDSLREADALERAAAAWRKNNRQEAWLLEGERLTDAETLSARKGFRDRLSPVRPYLLASRQREDQRVADEKLRREAELEAAREKQEAAEALAVAETEARQKAQEYATVLQKQSRKLRTVLAAMAVVALAATAASGWALHSERLADTRSDEAVASRLVAEAQSILADDGTGNEVHAINKLLAAPHFARTDADALVSAAADRRDLFKIIEIPAIVHSATYSRDGTRIVTGDDGGAVRVWDSQTGLSVLDPMQHGDAAVFRVAISPDGTRIASGDYNGVVRVWDSTTGQPIGTPTYDQTAMVSSLAFTDDGSRILSTHSDGALRWWDPNTGQLDGEPVTALVGGSVQSTAFSPDGRWLATGSADNGIRLWDLSTPGYDLVGETMTGHTRVVTALAFSPDSRQIVSGSDDGTVRLWDVATHREIGDPMITPSPATSVAFDTDGRRVVSGGFDGTIRAWDTDLQQPIGVPLTGHDGPVAGVAFSPDGRQLLSAGWDATVRTWDATTALPVTGSAGRIYGIGTDTNSHRIVSASADDESLRLWDLDTGKSLGALSGHDGTIEVVTATDDGHRLASGGDDGTVRVWDIGTGLPVGAPLTGQQGAVRTVDFSPDGRRLASAGDDGTVRLWNADTGQPIGDPVQARHEGTVNAIDFSPDGHRLVSGGDDGTVRLWNADTGAPVGDPIRVGPEVQVVGFAAHGHRVFSVSFVQGLQLWDPETGQSIDTVESGDKAAVFPVGISPDGTRIVAGGTDSALRQWDPETGRLLGPEMPGHRGGAAGVEYSPDGRYIVSGGSEGDIRLWDAETGRLIAVPMTGHAGWVAAIAFTSDGRRLVSGGTDGTLRIWNLPPSTTEEASNMLCSKLTRNMTDDEWHEWISPDIEPQTLCPDLPPGTDTE
ncbi:TIR domain-containing protein [Rhodococcus sp. CX]|uniref:nSTAND1 domain-containing NTPase n=1 Tax=Rhodococcus sp. CX TaxID=2789880 RepID=UPI0018CFB0CB|nr:TIR domain-containing protein [Rhodococcus sp. CX]MBH0122230.1 TIR domain-containing protein [Rhodococcus sp. CX]